MRRSLKSQAWKHWIKQIDKLLDDHKYKWAYPTLEGIKKTVKENRSISDTQIQAIKNIRNGLYSDKLE